MEEYWFLAACTKTGNTGTPQHPGTPEHRNTGTPEHSGTPRNTPEHPGTPRNTPEHPGTVEKTRNTDFDGVVLLSHYRPCKK